MNKILKQHITLIGVLFVGFLGLLDHLTGYEMSFSIFYLLPIIGVSWFHRTSRAVIISILSTLTWLIADVTSGNRYSNFIIPLWNAIMRLGFFFIITFFVANIKDLLEKEHLSARIDFLTEVNNSRAFYELAKTEINRVSRFPSPFTIAYIDIDNFKKVNDILGHNSGDELLHSLANNLKNNTRSIDIIGRLGGDEFAVFMPETNEEQAKTAINKIHKYLSEAVQSNKWPISFSIGVITCFRACKLEELIKEADNLMYSVKKDGKNGIKYKIQNTSATMPNSKQT
ncbi:MAG: GGDEF domain-containing protein [Candidatus Omnitrophica bacterium]|nr:GGDEF domain-containing protein [Candidatus Omnitrophota bacterium]MBU1047089.1 GGDEF domain-containing protein [Candidatus Omnitrophota bacterium]MBU1631541.1 GGDEF domain-containing protein [Candidatus Omnitrophota bacterium]MBU1767723.1 GGDEF domain-containing protein [Candidatus Omnitrophota bacterium]MBU1888755.1 GGDEF domain-containing protein [Candidatus Omnitrophota bacterium]